MPMWAEIVFLVFEAITFPVVILILVPVLVWLFFDEIKHRLGKSPITLPGGAQIGAPGTDDAPAIPQPPIASPAVEARVQQLRQMLDEHGGTNREHTLLHALAVSQFATTFELVYRVIYASQIKALKALNASPTGITKDALQAFLPQALVNSMGTTLDQWLEYLERAEFVAYHGQFVLITDVGKQFLIYVTDRRYSEFGLYPLW